MVSNIFVTTKKSKGIYLFPSLLGAIVICQHVLYLAIVSFWLVSNAHVTTGVVLITTIDLSTSMCLSSQKNVFDAAYF